MTDKAWQKKNENFSPFLPNYDSSFLPPAYVVRREGNVLTRVCPSINLSVHRGRGSVSQLSWGGGGSVQPAGVGQSSQGGISPGGGGQSSEGGSVQLGGSVSPAEGVSPARGVSPAGGVSLARGVGQSSRGGSV